MKYRQAIKEFIEMDKKTTSVFIDQKAKTEISESDQAKFIEYVETELLSLHEGNFARYMITPKEFMQWNVIWTKE